MALDESVGGLSSLIAIFLFLSTATVILRFIARYRQKNTLGLDDFIIIPAWVRWLYCSVICAQTNVDIMFSCVLLLFPQLESMVSPAIKYELYLLKT